METATDQWTFEPWRVLVVDDDANVGRAILRVLRPLLVTFAQSPSGALARILAGAKFEAIVCDVNMPGMSGTDFMEEVSRVAPRLADRFVFITGGAVEGALEAVVGRTGSAVVQKPFEPEALREAIALVAGRPLPASPAHAHRRDAPPADAVADVTPGR